LTPHKELARILNIYNPEILLVEITQADIEKDNMEKYPDEMVFAFLWAKKKNIPVYGFDYSMNTLAEGKTEKDNQAVIKEQKKIFMGYSWKDANRQEIEEILDTATAKALINSKKVAQRDKEMMKNIKKIIKKNKKTVIVTGVGHLKFFEKHIVEARFPLREEKKKTKKI